MVCPARAERSAERWPVVTDADPFDELTREDWAGMSRLGSVPRFEDYLRSIWARREFAFAVPVGDLRRQTTATSLGQLWHLLNPAMLVGVYWLIFDRILKTSRGVGVNFLAFLVVGIIFFQFSQRVVMDASGALVRHRSLIRSLPFPRILVPLGSVIGQSIEFAIASVVMFLTIMLAGIFPDLRWFAIIPLLAMQTLLNIGMALIAARLGEHVRDLSQILPHLFRILFYMSGVLFSVEKFVTDERLQHLFALNPFYDIVTLARWSLLGTSATWYEIGGLVGITTIVLTIGVATFRRAEPRIGA